MSRHIDADALIEEIKSLQVTVTGLRTCKGYLCELLKEYQKSVLRIIDEQPTVDVVEVVRCKDCAVPHNSLTGCPNLNGMIPPMQFFCAKGVRKPKTVDTTAAGNGD